MDLDARAVERWRPGDERPEVLDDILAWQPDPAVLPLSIQLPELFTEVPDLSAGKPAEAFFQKP